MRKDISDKIDELRAELRVAQGKLSSIHGRSLSIFSSVQGRDMNVDEQRQFDSLSASFDRTEAEVERLKGEIAELEATPMPRNVAPNPIFSGQGMSIPDRSAPRAIERAAPRTFAGMFNARDLPTEYAGFANLGEFALAVHGGNDARLIRNATMTTGVGVDGGFGVPTQFLGPILDAALRMEIVRPRANVVPITSKQALASTFDYADGTSAKRAGLQLLFGSEAQALIEQKGKLREVLLNAHKGSIFVRVSNELAADAVAFDRQLNAAMVQAVAAGLDLVFMQGTGAGQPMGIMSAPNLITVTKESGQAANTVMLQNLAKMVGRLSPSSYANSIWLVHPTCVAQLFLMSYTVQNVAGTENVGGTAAQAITQDAQGNLRIFGRPVEVTESCSPLSSAGDIVLADLSKYIVGLRADATIRRDESRYFDTDEIAFRLTLRVDGQPQDAAATKLRDGANTVSPFVALGAR